MAALIRGGCEFGAERRLVSGRGGVPCRSMAVWMARSMEVTLISKECEHTEPDVDWNVEAVVVGDGDATAARTLVCGELYASGCMTGGAESFYSVDEMSVRCILHQKFCECVAGMMRSRSWPW